MAITLISSGSLAVTSQPTSVNITGIQAGDLIIAAGARDFAPHTNPTSLTLGDGTGNSSLPASGWGYAFSTGSSFNLSGLPGSISSGDNYAWIWMVLRGVDPTNPFNISGSIINTTSNNTQVNPPSITTTVDGCFILAFGALDDDQSTVTSTPSGFTFIIEQSANSEPELSSTIAASYKQRLKSGTEDPGAYTFSTADLWSAFTVALTPASDSLSTGNISLDEVRLYLELATTASLQDCFTSSLESAFDPTYSGLKDRLSNFRGYSTSATPTIYSWLAVENGTATFALPITGSIIYEGNVSSGNTETVFIPETTIPTSSTNNVTVNRVYYSDTPFHVMDTGDNNIMVPFSLQGRLFGNYSSRYGTSTFYLYSLSGSASVDVFENTGVNGTPTTTISVADTSRSTYTYATDGTWIFFSSSADIIMSVEEASGDKHLMPPAATSIYRRRDNNERTVNNTTPSTISAYIVSDSLPVVAVEIGDGAGSDSSQGMGLANMTTDYFFGMELSDFHIVTPYQTEINVYYHFGNGTWVLAESIPLTGSLASPAAAFREGNTGFGSEGNLSLDSGGASYLAGGANLWWFKGDNPFMVTINDTSDDEEILVGANDSRTPLIPFGEFTFTVKTDNTGVSTSTQFQLPLVSAGPINLDVDWGDGSSDIITSYNQSETLHTYTSSGTYEITITGNVKGWTFNDGGDKLKMLNISKWGGFSVTEINTFYGCANLTQTATDYPTQILKINGTFRGCTNFSGSINDWYISNAGNNLQRVFQDADSFNQPIGNWDVSNVTKMTSLFLNASSFNQDLSSWNVSSVKDFSSMFRGTSFNQDIGGWDVSSVTNINFMFRGTPFDQDISSWDISGVTLATDFMFGVTLSVSNYNALLIGWESTLQTNYPGGTGYTGITIHFGSSQYTSGGAAETARTSLINTFGWTITDGGGI